MAGYQLGVFIWLIVLMGGVGLASPKEETPYHPLDGAAHLLRSAHPIEGGKRTTTYGGCGVGNDLKIRLTFLKYMVRYKCRGKTTSNLLESERCTLCSTISRRKLWWRMLRLESKYDAIPLVRSPAPLMGRFVWRGHTTPSPTSGMRPLC